jgi:hypothetical protein
MSRRRIATDPKRERFDHCGPTRKVRYRSEGAAEARLDELRVMGRVGLDLHRREARAYECIKCGGWHLTSQPKVQST